MEIFQIILLVFLVICAIAVCFTKNLLTSIIIFSSYSLVMSIVWVLLQSPDLAITEAAVGAGVTGVLFYLTLKKIKQIDSNLNTVENNDHNIVELPVKEEGESHEE